MSVLLVLSANRVSATRISRGVPTALLIGLFSLCGSSALAAELAAGLVNRMIEATKSLDYDGVFVHQQGTDLNTMRIIHKHGPDAEMERLITLSGARREVVRDGSRVKCIFGDDRAVMVGPREPSDFFTLGLTQSIDSLRARYHFKVLRDDRVAGRAATIVTIAPRDKNRYAHRLWIDKGSGLLLKSMVLTERGQMLEQMFFTSISINTSIPDASLEPELQGVDFTWYTNTKPSKHARKPPSDDMMWRVNWLPEGFTIQDAKVQHLATSERPVRHIVYSDGLATVSIFIEELLPDAKPLQGYSSVGAVNAYSRVADDYQITVVGEVPRTTVRQIAGSISRSFP